MKQKIKVLHVNTYDSGGGAANAAVRIVESVKLSNIHAELLVQSSKNNKKNTIILSKSIFRKFRPYLDKLPLIFYPNRKNELFSSAFINNNKLIQYINNSDFDIVHLHWVNAGMISIEEICKIKKPIVWTLHDAWAYTGGCHLVPESCTLFKEQLGCRNCMKLSSSKILNFDLAKVNYKRKLHSYHTKNDIYIVGVSNWITNVSRKSNLLSKYEHFTVGNPLDTKKYRIIKEKEKEKEKKVLLFIAVGGADDSNKGFQDVYYIANNYPHCIEIRVLGGALIEEEFIGSVNIKHIGYVESQNELINEYNSADCVIVPSRQESFGQVASESLSCGTPVVCYDSSGLKDIVIHQVNGYLAKAFEPNDLLLGVLQVLNGSEYSREACRASICNRFSYEKISENYREIYENVIRCNQAKLYKK
ncbi:glycosyltransferase [Vibrio vulnificus]|nr:glycosyltransferase [Vibrio vulnificus]EJO9872747.1 glycosyltransferase [Vibrio vulnificus]EJP4177725.1 glycosyltransferase [Vibrio vulnificus]EKJ5337877.1 glycosyltransferase [Vibrio vulnificus]MCU8562213.1 glycosyltransferase [Vibrio vulnificus]